MSQEHKLHFLVDSGPDIRLVKSYKLLRTAEFEPKDRVRVKSIDGSVIETHGSIETRIREGGIDIPFHFQLVSKQVDPKARFSEMNPGKNLLQGTIPDLSTRRLCNAQEINILTRAGTRSSTGSGRR